MTASVPPRSRLVVNVEMDDRSVLFPDGKFVTHVSVQDQEDGSVSLDAVFQFNESRADTRIAVLTGEDAAGLARAILDAVFQGRTQHMLSDTAKVAVVFNPNGFVLRFGEERLLRELFVASPAVLRLAQGLLRIADRLGAPPRH